MAQFDKLNNDTKQKELFSDEIQNIIGFLLEHYEIRIPAHDSSKIKITCKDENRYAFPPSSDDIWLHMKSEGYNVSETVLRKILRSPNYIRPCNPITEYFDSIRGKYRGESHIDLLSNHIVPRCFDEHPEEYYRQRTDKLIKKWLVASVACWIDNTPNDVALGFIHWREGIGKSHLVQYLMPGNLEEYFITSSRDDRKFDMEDAFTRYMMVYFDELDGLNIRNIDQFKKCMSSSQLLNKRRHEEYATTKPRIANILFTSNRNQELGGFLHESYGYRRFGIIELEEINRDYSTLVDIDQLWSEALNLYEETDYNFKFDLDDYEEFQEYNRRFMEETKAMKYLQMYVSAPNEGQESENLSTTEIYDRLKRKFRSEDMKELSITKIGAALKTLGYNKISYRNQKDISVKGYRVVINLDN